MLNKVVTLICLAILVFQSLAVIANVIFKKRADRILFIRGFKKGKCAIIYVIAIPLYWIGHMHAGQNAINAFFNAVHRIINLVVLKYETSSIETLMNESYLYSFTIYFCFILVGINAILFTISLTNQYIWCALQAAKLVFTHKNQLIVVGNNEGSEAVYNSDTTRNKILIDKITDAEGEELYLKKISYLFSHSTENTAKRILRLARTFYKREYVVVINSDTDTENLELCRYIVNAIADMPAEERERLFLNLKVFVFGDPSYEAIYSDVVSSGFGCVHYVNKYQKIAMDFIDRYPLTKFMDSRQIDYETSLVRTGVDVNVMLLGFGKTNQQVFLTSVANNQLLTEGEEGPVLKKINYYVFDKTETENNKNLNHSYYRYKHECKDVNPEEYLPLPELPAEEIYMHLAVNDCDFYDTVRGVVRKNENDANFIVIAFGDDLANLDMAQKLVEKRREWGLTDRLVIFVKVDTWHKEQTLLEDAGCYFIGNVNGVVYNVEEIVGDGIYKMAQMRNAVYDLEYDITSDPTTVVDEAYVLQNNKNAYRKWYVSKSQLERESSLYACLSLRSKLNLMNLDYCKEEAEGVELSEAEYLKIYCGDDMPDTSKYTVLADGKPIVSYTLDFKPSRRRNMAIHEHLRWNSFMISKGMIPSTRKQILEETAEKDGKVKFTNGKNYSVRRHGNLTTFDGLVEFRKMVAQRDGVSEESKDVIKYDYQLLDDAYWLLKKNGYKIIRHERLY